MWFFIGLFVGSSLASAFWSKVRVDDAKAHGRELKELLNIVERGAVVNEGLVGVLEETEGTLDVAKDTLEGEVTHLRQELEGLRG